MSADSSIMAAAIARNRRMVKSSTKAREQRVHYIIIAIGLATGCHGFQQAHCERKVELESNHEPWQKIGGRRSLKWRKLK
jgi:hypothetical protein